MWRITNESGFSIPPKGEPPCGFDNQKCKISMEFVSAMVFLVSMIFIVFWFALRYVFNFIFCQYCNNIFVSISFPFFIHKEYSVWCFRHYQYEQKLARLLWKVNSKEIQTLSEALDCNSQNFNERVRWMMTFGCRKCKKCYWPKFENPAKLHHLKRDQSSALFALCHDSI